MRIVEILLPSTVNDRSISPNHVRRIDALQRRMDTYVDKICRTGTSSKAREFLKAKLKDDYDELRSTIKSVAEQVCVTEAIHRLPLVDSDFDLVEELMTRPIPAAIAPIYIQEIIDDDELNDQLKSLEESHPNMDVRPLIAEWFKRVMPDQLYRFTGDSPTVKQRMGLLSPIHGQNPDQYHGSNDPVTGNAYGSR